MREETQMTYLRYQKEKKYIARQGGASKLGRELGSSDGRATRWNGEAVQWAGMGWGGVGGDDDGQGE